MSLRKFIFVFLRNIFGQNFSHTHPNIRITYLFREGNSLSYILLYNFLRILVYFELFKDVIYLKCDSLKDEDKKKLNFIRIDFEYGRQKIPNNAKNELTRDRKRPSRDPSEAGPSKRRF